MVKTQGSRSGFVFERVRDIIDGQWGPCAGVDELKQLQGATRTQAPAPSSTPIETEPVSNS